MRTLALLLPCLLLANASGADDFGRTVSAEDGDRLRIDLERGDVLISRHADPVVRLVATARGTGADAVRFRLDEKGPALLFRSLSEPWLSWLGSGPVIEVRAWVPHELPVEIETVGRVERLEPGGRVSYPSYQSP